MKISYLFLLLFLGYTSATAQPANDEPCGAITIPVESTGCVPTTVYSYTAATFSSALGNTFCNGVANRDVWYKITVPSNGSVTVAVANSTSSNMAVEMWNSTSCASLSLFNQNTNGFPCLYSNSADKITYQNLTPGSTVYLRLFALYDVNIAAGNIKICVSNPTSLSDEPCTAGFFDVDPPDPIGQNCVPYKTFSWTGASLTPAIANPSCLYSGYYPLIRDVWFKVFVPASGKLKINVTDCGYLISVMTASACNGTFTEIACLNCLTPGVFNSLVPNSIIYCRVFHNSSAAVADGSVKICVAEGNQIPGIDNSRKVGIGIDTPFAKLDVVGTGIFRDKVTTASDVEVRGNLIVQGSIIGKFGTTNLNNSVNLSGILQLDSFAFNNRIGNHLSLYGGLGTNNHYGFGIQSGLLQMYADQAAANLAFGYGNSNNFTERMRVVNSGADGMFLNGRINLKNGTSDINNGSGVWLYNPTNTAQLGFMGVQNASNIGFYGGPGAWGFVYNVTNSCVGIGNQAPTRPLSFPPSLGEKILLYPGSTGEVGIGVYGNELRMHADNTGAKISFGTQTNAGVFTEMGNFAQNGAYALTVFGSIWANGTTYASDERFKQNITPIASPLQKLLQLNGVEYEMNKSLFPKNNFMPGRQIGLLAQNVEKIIPEAVSENNGYKGVDYARLVPLLIEAIKEQQKEIEELKAIINR